MRPIPSPPVQLITGPWSDLSDLSRRVEAALRGGIRWVQLRAKDRCARDLHDAAIALAPLLREAGVLFVVNDRVDIALAAGADGVHLPDSGMTAADARRLLGPSAWIGRSLHSVDAIVSLGRGDVDAVQFGPVFETASKRGYGAPQGLAGLARAANAMREGPGGALIAVGGITAERAPSCRSAGAGAIAVIGAIWEAADVEGAARVIIEN